MKELLRIENINFKYEEKIIALNGVSAVFQEGERVAVLGSNGAGKSTFFLCVNGVLKPQSGKIFLKNKEMSNSKKDTTALRQAVGLVFQDPDSQIIAGSVESEISFGPMNLSLDEKEVRSRIMDSLVQMNLCGYEARVPQYLSGGEKKRVSIADILAMKPDIILLDEPTASLDPENVDVLEQTLDMLTNKGITLVVSTHDVDFAYRFATRAIVFSCGEIVYDGDIEKAFTKQDVLRKARLKKPLLYEVAKILERSFPEACATKRPRRIEEFESYVDYIKCGTLREDVIK